MKFEFLPNPIFDPNGYEEKRLKEKVVLCHGCFDVLHHGHLNYFKAAKKFGDKLLVSVTSDRYVNKGPGRPYFSAGQRAEMIKALGLVDDVIISDSPTAVQVIEQIKPDFYVKGPDYKDLTKDVTGEIYNEKEAVEAHGGKLVFTEEETHSSSRIINRHFQPWTDNQRATIDRVRSLGGVQAIEQSLSRALKLKVLVVGEPIHDIYRFVQPEGISSKSPSISARFQYEERYEGGTLAIRNHLNDFCDVDYLNVMQNIPKKIRYIAGTQRVFEVTEIDDQCPEYIIPSGYDVYIVADFGHGMFKGGELDGLKGFVGLNVQTNSSNYGFNLFHKHRRFDYLCLDTREARLATHDRTSSPSDIACQIARDIGRPFGFTAGSNGAYLLNDPQSYYSPAFSGEVIDATGAGDAYFAITTLLLGSGCNPELIPFIGNVFAGLKTRIIGNKSSVSKASLLKAIKGILA